MNLAEGQPRRFRRAVTLAALVVSIPALAAATGWLGSGEVWINVYWLAAALAAFALSLFGLQSLRRERRRYRLMISASLALYALGQVVWFGQVVTGWTVVPGPSDVLFLSCALVMSWAVVRVAGRGWSKSSGLIVALDALSMSLAVVVIATVVLDPYMQDLDAVEATFLLLYPILFLAPSGGALVSATALPSKLEWRGVWVLVVAWLILGASFSLWTASALNGGLPRSVVDYLFGVGLLLSGYGAATWPNEPSRRPREIRLLRSLSEALPVIAVIVAVVAVVLGARGGIQAVVAHVGLFALLVLSAVRQGLLFKSLHRSHEQLRALAAELSAIENRERREIADYLHDKVTQSLALLAMKFDQLHGRKDRSASERLERDIKKLLRQTVADTRSATFDLSPPILYTIGLEAALEWLGGSLSEKHGLEFEFSDDSAHKPLDVDAAALLFRFARELMLNSIKHAGARRLVLRVARSGADLAVTVEDDGRGFDPATVLESDVPSGFGLFSVRERVVSLGGRLEIDSSPGAGARLTLILPLRLEGDGLNGQGGVKAAARGSATSPR